MASGAPQFRNRLARERMPVAHRDYAARVHARLAQLGFQRRRLLLGVPANGRSAADHFVMMRNFLRSRGRDQAREGPPPEAREGEINDVGIAEEVIEERLNRLERLRSAELEEHDSESR